MRWYRTLSRWQKAAVSMWAAALAFISIRVLLSPFGTHNEYRVFAAAASNWLAGLDLYRPEFDPYRYSPLAAALLVPLGVLPGPLGSVVWRFVNAAVYLGSLNWWMRTALPQRLSSDQRAFVLLLVAPLSIGSVNNGQSDPLMLGLLLAATASVARRRWNLAAACAAGACLLKLYPIAVALLLAAVYVRCFAPRFIAALAIGLVLPFFLQRPAYVAAQTIAWARLIVSEPRYGTMESAYRDLRLLCRAWFAPLGPRAYFAVQLCAAAGIGALCVARSWRRWPEAYRLTLILGLGCGWMTVFGLSTESTSYMLLAPTLAWALLEAWPQGQPRAGRVLLLSSYGLFMASQVAGLVPGLAVVIGGLGLQPLGGLLLLTSLVLSALRRLSSAPLPCTAVVSQMNRLDAQRSALS